MGADLLKLKRQDAGMAEWRNWLANKLVARRGMRVDYPSGTDLLYIGGHSFVAAFTDHLSSWVWVLVFYHER